MPIAMDLQYDSIKPNSHCDTAADDVAENSGPRMESKTNDAEPKKRQRAWSACDRCRVSKTKCDGTHPVCSPCRRRQPYSGTCTFNFQRKRGTNAYREQLLQLERRLQKLENGRRTDNALTENHIPRQISDEQTKDTMGHDDAMLGLMDETGKYAAHRKSNSSVSIFMWYIENMIHPLFGSHDSRTVPYETGGTSQSPNPTAPTSDNLVHRDFVLPPRRRGDHLLDVYWRFIDPLYPLLCNTQLDSMYRSLWVGDSLGKEGKMFLCLLNAIFSLACNVDPLMRPEERGKNAAIYYERSRAPLKLSDLQHPSIVTVQYFLLSGQYLQSINKPQQCWMFVGLAVRVAQSLGLDLVATSAEAVTASARETMRKVWHGCILMDRTLSMTLGRPFMITPEAAATVPMPSIHGDDEICKCYSVAYTPDANYGSDLHFFVEALKLYELMNGALPSPYENSKVDKVDEDENDEYAAYFGSQASSMVGQVYEMDSKLQLWKTSLPIHLQYDPDALTSSIHKRQSHILLLRFHHARILLLRPVLSRFCFKNMQKAGDSPRNLPWKIALHLSATCARAALDTIDFFGSTIADHTIEECEDLLPAWWCSTFYIYTAATVLVVAQLRPALTAEVGVDRIMGGCQRIMNLFKLLQKFGSQAVRCAGIVHTLFEQVISREQKTSSYQDYEQWDYGQWDYGQWDYGQWDYGQWAESDAAEGSPVAGGLSSPQGESASHRCPSNPNLPASCCIEACDTAGLAATEDTTATDSKNCDLDLMFSVHGMNSVAFEEMTEEGLEGFNLQPDMNDLSWLNHVPKHLYEN